MEIFIVFLPEFLQDFLIKRIWNKKTDESILVAFNDATDWINTSIGIMESPTTIKIAENCITKLEDHIMPEMIRRNLKGYPA